MGHTGKSGSNSNSTRYSDVDNRTTPMSDADIEQVVDIAPYFQSSNSFTINKLLREMGDDASLEDTFSGWQSRNLVTVQTMDRNMLPLNKDINVARMAAYGYLQTIMRGAGFSNDEVRQATFGNQDVIDKMNARLAGTVVYEKQFLSTSYNTNEFNGAFRDRPLKMNIVGKAGTHAMFNPNKDEWDNESEMVFARGTGHKLVKFYYANDKLQVNTETVPQTRIRKRR